MELKKILVVYDPTREEQAALDLAAGIADDIGAELHLFGCVYDNVSDAENETEAVKRLIGEEKAKLDELLAPLAARGITTSSEVDWDKDLQNAVVHAAARDMADIVVKTASNSSGRKKLKSAADAQLLRECLCPVLLIKNAERPSMPRTLAAIDIQAKTQPFEKLNQHIIEFSHMVLDSEQADVHVVNAFQDIRFMPDRTKLTGLLGLDDDHVHIKLGSPDKVIVDVAKEIGASLVIVGNSHRSGLAALIAGNTAERIADKLDCNILAML